MGKGASTFPGIGEYLQKSPAFTYIENLQSKFTFISLTITDNLRRTVTKEAHNILPENN